MEIKSIKKYIVPSDVKKQNRGFDTIEIFTDRVECKGNIVTGDKTFFFSNYIGINWTPASLVNQNATVVFLTPENANNYLSQGIAQLTFDANRIVFCSGMYSYKTANSYALSLCEDIKKAYEAYKALPKDTGTTVVNQVSTADELKKFKELLDSGVITQAEFDAKKKQLLGL